MNLLNVATPKISFLHSGLPISGVYPIIFHNPEAPDFPGGSGTGFIARKGKRLFFITARHCLPKDQNQDLGKFAANLCIPTDVEGNFSNNHDYLNLDEAISLRHQSLDIPGEFIDFVAMPISAASSKQEKHLLSRAIKLPPNGQWLDEFFNTPIVQHNITIGGPRLTVIGHPSTNI